MSSSHTSSSDPHLLDDGFGQLCEQEDVLGAQSGDDRDDGREVLVPQVIDEAMYRLPELLR